MGAPREFVERYRTAFTQADLSALIDCFAFPLQVVSVIDGEALSSVAYVEDWSAVLERLLSAYQRLGVTDCVPRAVDISEPMDAVAVLRVHWALQREDREPLYDFTAVYTLALATGRLRIVALAHDELPKMQAALQRSRPT